MKKKILAALLTTATALMAIATPVLAYEQADGQEVEVPTLESGTYVEGEALVSMSATQAAALVREGEASFDRAIEIEECWDFGVSDDVGAENIKDYVALVSSEKYSTEELMEIVSEKFYVDAVAPNSYMHLCAKGKDTLLDYQWYLDGTGAMQIPSSGINYSNMQVTAVTRPVVALIDTGVDYTHEELRDSMWVNPYQSQGLKGTYGYDFADNDADPMDTYGHGTHCAGIITAQSNNQLGIAGISNAQIMSLKVTKDGEETFSTAGVVAAFEYVVQAQQMGVPVAAVNCSWGGSYDTGSVLNTLIDKMGENGALTVFAAGNDAVNWDTVAEPMRQTPYDLKSKYIVIVGASNEDDRRAFFSDYGNTQVDLFAPGSNILSTIQEVKFLPQFWEEKKRKSITAYYDTFSELNSLYKTAADMETVDSDYTVKLRYESGVGFSDQADGCLKYTVKYNKKSLFPLADSKGIIENGKEDAGFLYLDVTSLNLDINRTYYISCLMAENDSDGIPMWETFEKVSTAGDSRFVVENGRTYLALIGIHTKQTRSVTYYLDNIAISVADPNEAEFEKCDLMSGSSMAAPMVTAAIAILCGANPDLDINHVRSLLMECTRNVNAIENACVTGGILDLSRIAVRAIELNLNKTSAIVRYGKSLQLVATVSPSNATNAEVKWKSGNKKYAVVSSTGKVTVKKAGIGKTVKIIAVSKDDTKLKKTCLIKIRKAKL